MKSFFIIKWKENLNSFLIENGYKAKEINKGRAGILKKNPFLVISSLIIETSANHIFK